MTEISLLQKVSLVEHEGLLIASISHLDEEGVEFAFYVFRNEERIHVQWYGKSSIFVFNTGGEAGYYRVAGFVKSREGRVKSAKSNFVFANAISLAKGQLPESASSMSIFKFKGEKHEFSFLHYPGAAKKLFVLMSSAVERTKVSLPVFQRWTWAQKGLFPGEVLCVADPTLALHDDLRIGWYLGHKSSDLLQELADFIIEFAGARGVERRNIVIWGSSAGGFAALALSARVEGSIAVAVNPQTDAMSYEARGQVDLVRKVCFDDLPEKTVRQDFADRVNMASRWAGVQESTAVLMQNEQDKHHYAVHFKPFWTSLGGELSRGWTTAGRHVAWICDDNRGHAPETEEMAQEIVGHVEKMQSQQ